MTAISIQNHEDKKEFFVSQFDQFERRLSATEPVWLREIRKEAIARFEALGFPSARTEEWRSANLKPLLECEFALASEPADVDSRMVEEFDYPAMDAVRLTFVNGRFVEKLSSLKAIPDGVQVGSLAAALNEDPAWLESFLARKGSYEDNAFAALNTAFFQDGAYIHISRKAEIDKPIHLLYLTTAETESPIIFPRTLIVAGEGSRGTIVESYAGSGGAYWNNPLTETLAGEGSRIEHIKIQREAAAAYHISSTQIHLDRHSAYKHNSVMFGGAFTRNDLSSVLDGEGVENIMYGLYLANERQVMDNNTKIIHAKPNCHSWEMYKGILDDKAKGVFRGRIRVEKDAQKTDAKQSNRNLLLSENAETSSMPQLEIYADDVKCTHGSTTGQLDDEALFYLRTRGIDAASARTLLTYAFASEIVKEIGVEAIREKLDEIIRGGILSPTREKEQ
ncbi:MAG: Fe-S cluster assembly protein SufD [Candidatus Omnitrophota bacterium]